MPVDPFDQLNTLFTDIADAIREKKTGAHDFSTIEKFNSVLTSKIGWTVSQACYNELNNRVFTKSTDYPNYVIFGTDRGGSAQDLFLVRNQNSGEMFRMSDLEFIQNPNGGTSVINHSQIRLWFGRMYGYGTGNTVVNDVNNFWTSPEGVVSAGSSFQAYCMRSAFFVGTSFENFQDSSEPINAQDFANEIRNLNV